MVLNRGIGTRNGNDRGVTVLGVSNDTCWESVKFFENISNCPKPNDTHFFVHFNLNLS